MLAARVELLQQMPIFGGVREDALQWLLTPPHPRQVAAGGYFFHQGDPAQCMYVLESGRVAVIKQWQGHQLVLRQLGPGDCFGEMALLDLFPRSAAVRAIDDCLAIELAPADLLRLYEQDVAQFALVQMNLGREMSRRLRVTDQMLFETAMAIEALNPGAGIFPP